MSAIGRIILRNFTWRILFYISVFLLNISLSRYFSASGAGWIFYVSSLYAFLLLFLGFNLETALGYYLASNKMNIEKLTAFCLTWILCCGFVCCFFLKYLFGKISANMNDQTFIYASLGYILGNLFITFFSALFSARKNFTAPNIILTAINIGLILLLALGKFSKSVPMSDNTIVRVYFFAFAVQGILIFLLFLIKYVNIRLLKFPSFKDLQLLIKYSSWALITTIISFLLFRVDYWFVHRYCTGQELGNYIQTSKIVQIFLLFPSSISIVIFPMVASGEIKDVLNLIQKLSRIIFSLTGACCIIGLFTGYWIFPAIFGPSFNLMYKTFLLLIPGMLTFCSISPITAYFAGKKELHVNLIASSIALVVTLAGDVIFIPRFKITGAAIVSSIGYLTYAFFLMRYFMKEADLSYWHFFSLKSSDLDFIKRTVFKKTDSGFSEQK